MNDRLTDFSKSGTWRDRLGRRDLNAYVGRELRGYLAAPQRKSVKQQILEVVDLYRSYHCLPFQYLRHQLYIDLFKGDVADYIPHHYLNRFMAKVNPLEARGLVSDKLEFERRLRAIGLPTTQTLFVISANQRIQDWDGGDVSFEAFVEDLESRECFDYFIKPKNGVRAQGILPIQIRDGLILDNNNQTLDQAAFFERLYGSNQYESFLVQKKLQQHSRFDEIYDGCINTLRIITFTEGDRVTIDGSMLSMGPSDSGLDSWSNGGLIVCVDPESGRFVDSGRRKPSKGGGNFEQHPTSGFRFDQGSVPFWQELRETLARGALALRPLSSLGWDVAITEEGPALIEANDDWDAYYCQEGMFGLRPTAFGQALLAEFGLVRNSAPLAMK